MDNWKSIVFLLGSGQGILLSLALIVKGSRKREPSNIFLGLILWVIALELLNAWGMQVKYHRSPNVFPFWILQSYLVLPPSVWLFSQFTIKNNFKFNNKYLLLYLPSVVDVVMNVGRRLYIYFSREQIPSLFDNQVWFLYTEILPIGSMIIALILYGRELVISHNQTKGYVTKKTPIDFIKIYGLFSFMILLTTLWIAGVIVELPVFGIIEILLTLFLFTLGYIGYVDPSFFEMASSMAGKATQKLTFSNYDDTRQLQRLTAVFQQKALYTQSKLTLEDLSSQLNLPPRYVSYLINAYYGTNFNNFVNTYRIEEVIRKLNNPAEQHKTLLALALESGFNSKSAFNQVFKSHTGQSPSQYLLLQK